MPKYAYKAREATGKLIKGVEEAATEDDIAKGLRQKGYLPTHIEEMKETFTFGTGGAGGQAIKSSEMILFTIQLANMIDAGLPIIRCIHTVIKQVKNEKFRKILQEVAHAISAGSSFSEALARYPETFSNLFINVVRSGEISGKLHLVLNRYAVYIERQEEIRQKIRNAFFYPIILVSVGFIVILVIVSFVIPKYMAIFNKAHVPLPLPTLVLYHIGIVIKQYWYVFLLGIAGVVAGLKVWVRTPAGRIWFDRFQLKVPLVKTVVHKTLISRFCRTLATLLKSGVPVLNALDITKDVIDNTVIADVIAVVRREVEGGKTLVEPLQRSIQIPSDVIQMVAVGEETGKLDILLDKVADYYDSVVEYRIRKLIILVEPALVIIMGSLAGFIMASMILPLFDMIKTIQH